MGDQADHCSLITWPHLHVGLGLGQADDLLAFLPLTALLQELDPFEAF